MLTPITLKTTFTPTAVSRFGQARRKANAQISPAAGDNLIRLGQHTKLTQYMASLGMMGYSVGEGVHRLLQGDTNLSSFIGNGAILLMGVGFAVTGHTVSRLVRYIQQLRNTETKPPDTAAQ